MDKKEHLLTCLIEECAEIQQAATKALRFGLTQGNPLNPTFTTNAQDIENEVIDLIAILELLQEGGFLHIKNSKQSAPFIDKKKQKVVSYMELAEQLGILKNN